MNNAVAVVPIPLPASGVLAVGHRGGRKKGARSIAFAEDVAQPSKIRRFCDKLRWRSRALSDSWRFNVLTTVLTVYALVGDDFRLAATQQAFDNLFNVFTVCCLLVFSTEIVAASLGKEEYFLGFFFLLDVGSTITLIFDLTWVWNEIACNVDTDADSTGALRTSRAGRAGARAARTVRIIRLLRLVKLYKTYKTALEQKDGRWSTRRGSTERAAPPGEGEDDDLFDDDEEEGEVTKQVSATEGLQADKPEKPPPKPKAETRVGKKLSEMTTRRVIILVLVMLFIMPLFLPSQYGFDEFRTSGDWGVELIYDRLRTWCFAGKNTTADQDLPWCLQLPETPDGPLQDDLHDDRAWYERYLLSFIYEHHQNVENAWQLCWVGMSSDTLAESKGAAVTAEIIGQLAQLNQERFLGGRALVSEGLQEWNSMFMNSSWQTSQAELSESVRLKLVQPWREKCFAYYGVSVSPYVNDDLGPTACALTEELRCSEMQFYIPLTKSDKEGADLTLMFVFDIRGTTQLAAGLSIIQTIFICFAVGIGAMSFSSLANKLLLNPIERMIAKMETIKDNPLEAMKLGDAEFRREEIEAAKRQEQLASMSPLRKFFYNASHHLNKVKEPMETVILEKTIIKLGGLLALGFGEAGAEIIGANMRGGHSAGVNAMVPGSKVDAIIGFCNIQNFTDATEVLKEKVMVFVNQIGEIVHGCVDDYHGAPNKNIGDCFLLIWRLSGVSAQRQTKLADMAIMSFVRILAEINKSRVLAVYRDHPGLLQRIPKYRVTMGFGLHCGWAIEGAIGSEFKIDASYLSPNVNVASRLEAACEQFDVWILISHFMINLCSQEMAKVCRLIDHVTVKGSRQPIRLYTLDMDYHALQVQPRKAKIVTRNRFKLRQIREVRKNEKWAEDYTVCEACDADEDIIIMRKRYSPEFFLRFAMAYRNYEAGEWMVARDMLFTCHYSAGKEETPDLGADDEWPEDGPSQVLLLYMKQTHYYPPNDWAGHRELTQK